MDFCYDEEIAIAREKLSECMLLFPFQQLIFELYYYPSVNAQTYFAQIGMDGGNYYMHYAKTEMEADADRPYGALSFRMTKALSHKPMAAVRVVCGSISLKKEAVLQLQTHFKRAPAHIHRHRRSCRMIDGEYFQLTGYDNGKASTSISFLLEETQNVENAWFTKTKNSARTLSKLFGY